MLDIMSENSFLWYITNTGSLVKNNDCEIEVTKPKLEFSAISLLL